MKISETIKERLLRGLIAAILGSIGWLATSIAKDAVEPFLKSVLPAINNKTLLLLCLMLFLVILILGTWVAFLLWGDKSERERKHYRFDQTTGTYVHKTEPQQRACASCWQDGVRPLKIHQSGWWCLKCNKYFEDPARIVKTAPPGSHISGRAIV